MKRTPDLALHDIICYRRNIRKTWPQSLHLRFLMAYNFGIINVDYTGLNTFIVTLFLINWSFVRYPVYIDRRLYVVMEKF